MGKRAYGWYDFSQVRRIAHRYNFVQIPLKSHVASHQLSFKHRNMRSSGGSESYSGPVRIDVYFTTGTVNVCLRKNGRHSVKVQKRVIQEKLTEIFSDANRQFLIEN